MNMYTISILSKVKETIHCALVPLVIKKISIDPVMGRPTGTTGNERLKLFVGRSSHKMYLHIKIIFKLLFSVDMR